MTRQKIAIEDKNRNWNIDRWEKFVVEIIFFRVREIIFDFGSMKFNFIRKEDEKFPNSRDMLKKKKKELK